MILLWTAIAVMGLSLLAYYQVSLRLTTVIIAAWLYGIIFFSPLSFNSSVIFCLFFLGILVPLNIAPLRRGYFSAKLLRYLQSRLPQLSSTEEAALMAGEVGWEGEFFTGHPNWQRLQEFPRNLLSIEEQAFLLGPVASLSSMIDDWEMTHKFIDLPTAIWDFLKQERFFGMMIPKEYGGLGFSAAAHAAVLTHVYSRSVSVATTIAVPNSLGPAELILKYGTTVQKEYYLPRLATGEEIPCFALTGPDAGSDAAGMTDTGIISEALFEGNRVLGIRLNWNKRYITLAPIATLMGLAFHLFDPDHLLGSQEDLGITCALIPRHLSGITIGRRHYPAGAAFMNGPTQGKDVFIPIDYVIGGVEMIGHGWQMLMECLGVGRAITLPASAVGTSKALTALSTAYTAIRQQFKLPLAAFEGVQAPLVRMAAYTYLNDAALSFTVARIDTGISSPVASAIIKYHTTENNRQIINDALDIHGGKGICQGPSNYLSQIYQTAIIGITVEGANILTRSLIIFGQGVIRCHPYVLKLMQAVKSAELKQFDEVLLAYLGHILSCKPRALWLSLTRGRWQAAPASRLKRYYQWFSVYSAGFAYLIEVALILLGAHLKRREQISARFSDILSYLYLASAVLKRYKDQGEWPEDLPLVTWICQDLLWKLQQTFIALLANLPHPWLMKAVRWIIFPYGLPHTPPSDKLTREVAELITKPSATRERLLAGIDLAESPHNPIAKLNTALQYVVAAAPLEQKLATHPDAYDPRLTLSEKLFKAQAEHLLTAEEAEQVHQAASAREAVIAVDDFAVVELGASD